MKNNLNQTIPQQISLSNVKSIACGGSFSMVLLGKFFFILLKFFEKEDGTLHSFGNNDFGQLGIGKSKDQLSPQKVAISNVDSITCGLAHSFAITSKK